MKYVLLIVVGVLYRFILPVLYYMGIKSAVFSIQTGIGIGWIIILTLLLLGGSSVLALCIGVKLMVPVKVIGSTITFTKAKTIFGVVNYLAPGEVKQSWREKVSSICMDVLRFFARPVIVVSTITLTCIGVWMIGRYWYFKEEIPAILSALVIMISNYYSLKAMKIIK